MKQCLAAVLIICLCVLASCFFSCVEDSSRNSCYFDGSASEGGDGTLKSPFNSPDDVKKINFNEVSEVLFKRGTEFFGSWVFENLDGVTIGDYGEGSLPVLNGNDCAGVAVLTLENCRNTTVKNLEICDSATEEDDRRGVLVNVFNPNADSDEVITYENITLTELFVHDIRGIVDAEKFGMTRQSKVTGGIHVWSSDGLGRCDGLEISHCVIENVDNVGIATWFVPQLGRENKNSPYSEEFSALAHKNVRIAYNDVSNIGKNAIFARNLLGGVVEHNTVYDTASRCRAGNSICTSGVFGTVVQFNEGYRNNAIQKDGCMLDADIMSRETIWQYNYSHDNAFGLFVNCTLFDEESKIADSVIVRFNLSVNDYGGDGENGGIIYVNYKVSSLEIYNNTIFVPSGVSPVILRSKNNRNFSFFNNLIVCYSQTASFVMGEQSATSISNNLFYNASNGKLFGEDTFVAANTNGIYVDPQLCAAAGLTLEARIGFESTSFCKLGATSAALGGGIRVEDVTSDFFGNAYSQGIGCCVGI